MKMLSLTRRLMRLGKPLVFGLAVLLAWLYPYAAAAQHGEGGGYGHLSVSPPKGHSAGPTLRTFTIELSSKGFNGSSQLMLEVEEGDEVEITFIFVEDLPFPNAHRIAISDYGVDTGVLNASNPKATERFTANKMGTFAIICLYPCGGHLNMVDGKFRVKEGKTAGVVSPSALSLATPERAIAGKPVHLTATLKDKGGAPIPNAKLTFVQKSSFFVEGLMELEEATTNAQGIALLEYTPREEGSLEIVAKYAGSGSYSPAETQLTLTVEAGAPGYLPQAGIKPVVEMPRVSGPTTYALSLRTISVPISAPWGLALLLSGIWSTYFIVAYQVLQIGVASASEGVMTKKLVPMLVLGFVIVVGSTLVWMVLTSPYTHHHLGPPPVPWPAMEDIH